MKFVSQYKKYKLWIAPSYHTMDSMGQKHFTAGKCAKFDNGVYETNDTEMIEALLKDPLCGVDYAPVQIAQDTTPAPELAKPVDNYAWAKVGDQKKDEDGLFRCTICDKTVKTKLALAGHMRSHRNS